MNSEEEMVKQRTAKSYVTSSQRKLLRDERKRIPATLREAFATAFAAWMDTWFSGGLSFDSDPHSRTIGKEFNALVALGPEIIPLLIEELADPENFLALQLYDAIQPNVRLIVHFGPNDKRIVEGEQGRARRVVQAWFANR